MKKKIYFRADAGADIGYGHFIRTLALADMLKDDFDCMFFTVNPTSYQIAEMEKVCEYVDLQADTRFNDFLSFLTGDEIVVLDNYFFTTEYQQQIKSKGCHLVCIDDMHDKYYVADVVINHGFVDECLFDKSSSTKLCLGLGWALLRHPFINAIEYPCDKKENNLFVFAFGGSDPKGLSRQVANVIERLDYNSIYAIGVLGDSSNTVIELDKYKKVQFVQRQTATEIAELFKRAGYVILPASTMCLEAIACRARLIVGYFVDNQKAFSEYLALNDYSEDLGDMTDSSFEERLSDVIHRLLSLSETKYEKRELLISSDIRIRYKKLFHSLSYI